MKRMPIDMQGKQFGSLLVLRLAKVVRKPRQTRTYWTCQCVCGAERVYRGDVLRSGRRTDCGCISGRPDFLNSLLTVNGVAKNPKQWARMYGIRTYNIYDRLKNGMDVELAVTAPVGRPGHNIRKKSFARSEVADTTSRQDDNH